MMTVYARMPSQRETSMVGYKLLVRCLVYAGALPFVGTALLVLLPRLLPALDATALFTSYALVILSFLCGVHWGQGLAVQGRAPLNLFVLSNALVVLLWLAHAFLSATVFLALVLLELLLLLWIDRRLFSNGLIEPWYYRTRIRITLLVFICTSLVLLS